MSADRWRLFANIFAILVVVGIAWAWIPYATCVYEVSNGMVRELNPLTEQGLAQLIDRATAGVEKVPTSFGDRIDLAQPVCRKENPYSDGMAGYILAILGVIGFVFCRNQIRLTTVDVDREIARERKQSRTASRGGRESVGTPSVLEVEGLDIGLSDRDRQILESVGDVNSRDESLMMYLQRKSDGTKETAVVVPPEIEGFYCPPGYADKSVLWVDPSDPVASDDLAGADPVNNKARPLATLGVALDLARRLVHDEDHKGVMIRMMPGVYTLAVEIPDRCVVVNHRLPAEGSFRSRLKWMTDQVGKDSEGVTILAPKNSQWAVQFEERGANQGIFGCHIAGRKSVKQAGIVAVACRGLTIGNCTIEGFMGGGIRLQDAGTELAGGQVLIHGCMVQRNESKIGGGIYALRSSLAIVDSIIERNKAVTGGAIWASEMRAPLALTDCRVAHNRAQREQPPEIDLQETKPAAWDRATGLGGGVYVRRSRFKATGTEFVENGASTAGGGLALVGCRAILDQDDYKRPRFARNKARVGGGAVLIGWHDNIATLKATNLLAEKNVATLSGGALAAIGKATLQFVEGAFTENEASGEDAHGGALSVHLGAELQISEVELTDNKSGGSGGAIAAIDANLTIKNSARIRANLARVSGGGIYAITTASAVAVELARERDIKVPLSVVLGGIKISNNASGDLGGGFRGGNDHSRATLPLSIEMDSDVVFQLNRTKSQVEHGDDIWVAWAGQVKATDRNRSEKLTLR